MIKIMNKIKKILYVLISYSFITSNIIITIAQNDTKNKMLPKTETTLGLNNDWWTSGLNQVFSRITDLIFSLLIVIWIGVFLYFGYRLVMARWNPEELKKVLIWFVYAIVWLAIIPLSYAIVRIVSSLSF